MLFVCQMGQGYAYLNYEISDARKSGEILASIRLVQQVHYHWKPAS